MVLLAYFLGAIAIVLDYVLLFVMILVGIRAVLSWVSPDPFNPIVRFIYNTTEPVLSRIRAVIPVSFGGIDFSPIIVFLAATFLREWLVNSLSYLSRTLH